MGQPNFSRVKRSIWQQMGRQQHFAERLVKFARHLSGPTHPVTREMPGRCAVAFTIKVDQLPTRPGGEHREICRQTLGACCVVGY